MGIRDKSTDMKKTSYKTNSWWNHRVSKNTINPNRNIDTWEDKRQDAYLKALEKARKDK